MAIPSGGWAGLALAALLLMASVFAHPARLFLTALVCKLFKVAADDIAGYLLEQAKKGHASPVAETVDALARLVAAMRGGRPGSGATDDPPSRAEAALPTQPRGQRPPAA